jgi:hypothetical protein
LGQTVSDKLALCQFGRAFHTRLEIFSAAGMAEINYLQLNILIFFEV